MQVTLHFQVNPPALRMGLLRERFQELPIRAEHLCAVQQLHYDAEICMAPLGAHHPGSR
jgi:hypothetical protein